MEATVERRDQSERCLYVTDLCRKEGGEARTRLITWETMDGLTGRILWSKALWEQNDRMCRGLIFQWDPVWFKDKPGAGDWMEGLRVGKYATIQWSFTKPSLVSGTVLNHESDPIQTKKVQSKTGKYPIAHVINSNQGFPGGSMVKNPPANAGDAGSILGWEDPLEREWQPTPAFLLG